MATVDADAHVIETERTWDYLDEAEAQFRPLVARTKDARRDPESWVWVVEGKLRSRGFKPGSPALRPQREMEDIPGRLKHMDELGVDVQVLFPTLFLEHVTSRPEVELALCKSYNRWLADIWRAGKGRLRWVVEPPLLTMDKALEELNYGKEHGACGVHLHGIEGDRLLCDPYFFPLYEEASRLNMAICLHAGHNNLAYQNLVAQDKGGGLLMRAKVPVFAAMHSLVISDIPAQFPKLRFGFLETTAQWVPYVVHELVRRLARDRKGRDLRGKLPTDATSSLMRENRLYVTVQTSDDIGWILQYAGPDNLVVGTDYGHADTSTELEALHVLKNEGELDPVVVDKMLSANGRALYGL